MEDNPSQDVLKEKLITFGILSEEWQALVESGFSAMQEENQQEDIEPLLTQLVKMEEFCGSESYPPKNPDMGQVFACTKGISPGQVSVVIIGQDPSLTLKSLGYAFGTAERPSSSLKVICDCIARELEKTGLDLDEPVLKSGRLEGWIQQGVILINACPFYKEELGYDVSRAIVRGLIERSNVDRNNTTDEDNGILILIPMGMKAKSLIPTPRLHATPGLEVIELYHPNYPHYNKKNVEKMVKFNNNFFDKMPFLYSNWLLFQQYNNCDKLIDWTQFEIAAEDDTSKSERMTKLFEYFTELKDDDERVQTLFGRNLSTD